MFVAENLQHTPLAGSEVWMGESAQASDAWIHRISGDGIAEIDAAYRSARDVGNTLATLTREQFP